EEEPIIADEPIAAEEPIIADEPIAAEEPIIADEPVIDETVTTEEPAAEDLALDEVFADIEASQTAGAMAAAAAMEQESVMEIEEIQTEDYMNKGAESTMDSMRDYSEETSVITGGMRISGDVTTEGSLDLVGSIAGDVTVNGKLNVTGHIIGNSKAKEVFAESAKITGDVVSETSVKVGAGTVIVGNITATSAAIAGAVKGDIDVKGPVILDSTAIVMGNIRSKSVQINNGAAIEGNCSQCYADVSPTAFFEEYKVEKKAAKAEKAAK
ncbi:MAG: polymer-forming cytoskeletal protein, partial [Lachnospiraceae bacterium]|nr:polymer-forming cytoskeletal protein [Lachnospiraceae bacterium]